MRTSMLLGMFDFVGEICSAIFNLIPKIIYLLYAALASFLDVLQFFFRKLAGLDVYYQEVNGKIETISGDLVTNFITGILGIGEGGFKYSALTTVFWSMIIFGVIVCLGCVFIAVIKSHYSYDEKAAKGPMQYVYTGLKSLINIVAVPVIIVLGLWVSQALLTALDQITSTTSSNLLGIYGASNLKDNCDSTITTKNLADGDAGGSVSYIYYDIFGVSAYIQYGEKVYDPVIDHKQNAYVAASSQTFSGSLFKAAAYNGNRVRTGSMNLDNAPGMDEGSEGVYLFRRAKDIGGTAGSELLAQMIDEAFASHLHLKKNMKLNYSWLSSADYSTRYLTFYNMKGIATFSKFNVGAIWAFYDLWQFNFIVGFGGIIVCVSIFLNIILGLITRLFMCVGLFLIAPPVFALEPLDGGKGKKGWIENFMKQALMAYGAVVGMNIFFLIFPYINTIKFFNIEIIDYLVNALVIIVGLITVKAFIGVISGLIGAADANKTGDEISKEVGSTMGKATSMALAPGKLAFRAGHNLINYGREKSAEKESNLANKEYEQAKADLSKAEESGDDAAIEAARRKVDETKDHADNMANKLNKRKDKHEKSKGKLKNSATGLVNAITTPFASNNFFEEARKGLGMSTLDETLKKHKEEKEKEKKEKLEGERWSSLLGNTSQAAQAMANVERNSYASTPEGMRADAAKRKAETDALRKRASAEYQKMLKNDHDEVAMKKSTEELRKIMHEADAKGLDKSQIRPKSGINGKRIAANRKAQEGIRQQQQQDLIDSSTSAEMQGAWNPWSDDGE